jgi:electron transport complex protein RnfC
MAHRLWTFPGGLRLPGHKDASVREPVVPAALPRQLILPLQQHIGAPAEPVVEEGERVLKGQVIAQPRGYVSVPIHAPSSGVVTDIGGYPAPHPSGLSARCIVIDTDGRDAWIELRPLPDYRRLDPSALRNRIRDAGIVGLGGAGFPTYVKLNPGPERPIRTLILNGAECEPYITCDDMLMRGRARDIVLGTLIMRHALGVSECLIGVEDDKPQALAALQAAVAALDAAAAVAIVAVPTRYPAGGEKQLIQMLTGKEVPAGELPADIGVICQNVGTAAAIARALERGQPLLSRYVTVAGGAAGRPRNLEVLIGTPVQDVLAQCETSMASTARLLMGGPMMGIPLRDPRVPVVKGTNCLLALSAEDLGPAAPTVACIRCGKCAEVCPVRLLPQQLYWHARAKDFAKVQDYNLFDCIECGCCAYVCPSHIPLVQYYRYAKAEIWAQERERRKAELARRRHDARVQRLEREKAERAARLAQKQTELQPEQSYDSKKAAIQAALERVQAKKRAAETAAAAGAPRQEEDAVKTA